MIEDYLREIDALLSTSASVRDVVIIRRTIRDTELEKVLNYRYRVTLADGGLVEITKRILEMQETLEGSKYRHHWQDSTGRMIKRWDNAPHHPTVDTFPHHLHDGSEDDVVGHSAITGLEALQRILVEIETRGDIERVR